MLEGVDANTRGSPIIVMALFFPLLATDVWQAIKAMRSSYILVILK